MILLCFFSSMIITNDVSLITFVPFTILVFRMVEREDRVLKLIVLETIAANLGSMATPIGNPQNLYLYSISEMPFRDFAWAVWPYTALALVLLILSIRSVREAPLAHRLTSDEPRAEIAPTQNLRRAMLPFLALLALCLLVVFRVLPYGPVLLIVVAVILSSIAASSARLTTACSQPFSASSSSSATSDAFPPSAPSSSPS